MSIVDDDVVSNTSGNETFESVVAARVSRRSLLRGGAATAGAAVALTGADVLARAVPAHADGRGQRGDEKGSRRPAGDPLLGFEGIAPSTEDRVVVPPGYLAEVLIAWGDPVSAGPAFKQDGSNTADDQAKQWGMHNDGIVYFPINRSSSHGVIVQNHEYTDDGMLFTDGAVPWTAAKTAKSQNAHGVGIIEVKRRRGRWEVVRPSKYGRRITAQTPIDIAGPAAGHSWLRTGADPTGRRVLGTLNNCAMGYTPWGTYLACEENFNGYFHASPAPAAGTLLARYGVAPIPATGTQWYTTDARFDVAQEPNESNRFGWVTEIDPWNPKSRPVKRTALGRLKHEGAWVQEARDGRIVVYTGDDQVFEYIYRYVSNEPWRKAIRRGVSPLDEGILYVARFHANGTGEWLPLTTETVGWPIEEILINTRGAADIVGATKMDRPEWIDTYPDELMAVATLTNNTGRGVGTNPGVDAPNPRANNVYGHILRWGYDIDFTGDTFWWDFFALAGDRNAATPDGSTVNGDKFAAPDGLYVAPSGRMWIQTDISSGSIETGAYVGYGNNQMLCADPTTRRVRRFLVGPKRCEITGCFATPDETTLFVGIQHPGEPSSGPTVPGSEKALSSWPDGNAGGRPRSALLAITKFDGGEIGS